MSAVYKSGCWNKQCLFKLELLVSSGTARRPVNTKKWEHRIYYWYSTANRTPKRKSGPVQNPPATSHCQELSNLLTLSNLIVLMFFLLLVVNLFPLMEPPTQNHSAGWTTHRDSAHDSLTHYSCVLVIVLIFSLKFWHLLLKVTSQLKCHLLPGAWCRFWLLKLPTVSLVDPVSLY